MAPAATTLATLDVFPTGLGGGRAAAGIGVPGAAVDPSCDLLDPLDSLLFGGGPEAAGAAVTTGADFPAGALKSIGKFFSSGMSPGGLGTIAATASLDSCTRASSAGCIKQASSGLSSGASFRT